MTNRSYPGPLSSAELTIRGPAAAGLTDSGIASGEFLLVPPDGEMLRVVPQSFTRSFSPVGAAEVSLRAVVPAPGGLTDLPSAGARDLALAVLRGEPRAAELARRVLGPDRAPPRHSRLLSAWLAGARLFGGGWPGRLLAATEDAVRGDPVHEAALACVYDELVRGLLDDPAKGDACEDAGCEGR